MRRSLNDVHRLLACHYGDAAAISLDDPFQLIQWEQVAYLANDERRRKAFELLATRVGVAPREVAAAGLDVLLEIAAAGGPIGRQKRAERMRESARRAISEWGGDLRAVLRLPAKQALRALSRFPMIGKPGAEKILLLSRAQPLLALDSNGLRVLLRLGYGAEGKRYDQSYASVRAAVAGEQSDDYDRLISLHWLLRRHGQRLCRRRQPDCASCPLTSMCTYYDDQTAA